MSKKAGYIEKETAERYLKSNLEYFKTVSLLPREVLASKIECEKEAKGIELLLNSDEALDKYISIWNDAITTLHEISYAAAEYGKTVESLFGIYYWK